MRLERHSAQGLEARLLYARELASQAPVLALLLSCALAVPVSEICALEWISPDVIHLPLIGTLPLAS